MTMLLLPFFQQLTPPAGGVPVVPADSLVLQGQPQFGTVERVPVTGQPFSTAVRVTTTKTAPNEWEFEVGADATVAVRKGDVMLATVWTRAIKGQPETGEGRTTLDFQVKGGDWSKSVSHPISISKAWRRTDIPFVAGYDTPAGGANVAFRLGGLVQTVEIGGLSILNFGASYDIARLPRTAIRYAGQEADAPWRAAALARIERIRKGDLTIRTVDADNRPVAGVRITMHQTRQAFAFGTAVAADALVAPGADGDRYREEVLKGFNRATVENHLKWPVWEGGGRKDGLAAVDWLVRNGMTVRAHNVVWPSWRNSPRDLPGLSAPALRRRVEARIDDVVTAVRGKVAVWDVVNEPFDNHDVFDRLAPERAVETMAGWFRRVKAIDPKPRLVLNDYPPLDGAAVDNAHLESFYRNLAGLKALGAPVEGIGFQCHVGGDPIPPVRLRSGLDRFARLGLPIEVTEFDIDTQDRAYQERYMRDFLIAVFSHPSVDGFTQWGFTPRHHWLPEAALFNADWSLRPHGKAYYDLVGSWRTDAKGQTGASGTFKARGFTGDYEVTIQAPGRPARTLRTSLSAQGRVTVVQV